MSLPHNVEVTTHNLHFHDQASIYSVDSKGAFLATAGGDTDVRVWEVEKCKAKEQSFCHTNALSSSVKIHYRHTLSAHQRTVNCVRFGDRHLASSSDGGHVLVWRISEFAKDIAHTVRASDGDDAYEVRWSGALLFVGLASGNVSVYRVGEDSEEAPETPARDSPNEDPRRARIVRMSSDTCPARIEHVQTVKAHSDIVQGLSFNPFHSVLATISKDRSFKTFHLGERLKMVHRGDSFGDKKFIAVGRSFFKRISFVGKDFLFLTNCVVDEKNVVLVYAYPFRSPCAQVGPFDSTVQCIFEWGRYVAIATKRSLYLVSGVGSDYRSVFAVNNLTFLPTTDTCVVEDVLFVSSLDGFLSSVRLS